MYDMCKLSTEIVSDAHVRLRHRIMLHAHTRGERAFRSVEEIFWEEKKEIFNFGNRCIRKKSDVAWGTVGIVRKPTKLFIRRL